MVVVPLSAPNAEKLSVAYLAPHFSEVGTKLPLDPPLPFILVRRISGPETEVTDHATVSIHCFAVDMDAAGDLADAMHDLMKLWTPLLSVSYGGENYGIEKLYVVEKPIYVDYMNNNMERYVGRYRLQLRAT